MQKPISVVLGADSLASRRSGIGRVTIDIGEALRRSAYVAALKLWVRDRLEAPEFLDQILGEIPDEQAPPRPKRLRILVGRMPGVQELRSSLKKRAMREEVADLRSRSLGRLVYHETNMITKPFDGVVVSHIHDLSWLHHRELHPADRLTWIEGNLDRTLRDATRFVAVSEFTADSFSRDLNVGRERIDVVPNAVSPAFRPRSEAEARETLAVHGLADRSYVLSVSTLEPRKNFDRLLAAHRVLPRSERERVPLVIVGGAGWGTTLENREAEEARREGTLRMLGYQPDHVLVNLTARAACVAYVSLYEGFGLPVLEAMATGTPVIASATTAVGETAGEAALLVDATNVAEISAALELTIGDPAVRSSLCAKGLKRAAEFSSERTVEGLIASWSKALSQV